MKIDHQTMLEAFEETGGRGDVLSIPREDLLRLKAVPLKRFAPIFNQLIKWFVDGDETPLEDPLANAMLEGFKEHQRVNAKRRLAFLKKQAASAKKGAEARWGTSQNAHGQPTATRGQPRVAQVKAKAKAEAKEEAKAISSFASVGDGASRAVAAPPTPISVKEAKKFLAMDAPQISSLPGMQTAKGQATRLCLTLLSDDIDKVVKAVGDKILDRESEDDYEDTCDTFDDPIISMAERMEAIGKLDVFRKVLVKAMVDSEADGVDNPAAFVMARCKKGVEAIQATTKP